jgi:hypothetical protein
VNRAEIRAFIIAAAGQVTANARNQIIGSGK